jgi:hypothetical protein
VVTCVGTRPVNGDRLSMVVGALSLRLLLWNGQHETHRKAYILYTEFFTAASSYRHQAIYKLTTGIGPRTQQLHEEHPPSRTSSFLYSLAGDPTAPPAGRR